MTPTRVLFVHGLESGPLGRKSRALREAGFEVIAEAMPCSQRSMLKEPRTLGLLAAATLLMVVSMRLGWPFALGAALLVLFSAPLGLRYLIRSAFRESVAVQVSALRGHAIDVVVGSSYGGAVALELLRSGAWKGPTVLLCPAHRLVAARAGTSAEKPSLGAHVVVVHGARDTTVPLADSVELVRSTKATLLQVDDDHRLNQAATPSALFAWVSLAMGR